MQKPKSLFKFVRFFLYAPADIIHSVISASVDNDCHVKAFSSSQILKVRSFLLTVGVPDNKLLKNRVVRIKVCIY